MIAKRNYKVYANIGIKTKSMRGFATVLDTGAASSFISLDALLHRLGGNIEPLGNDVTVGNASGKTVSLRRTIDVTVQRG